jgi:hypothetical protein
VEAAAAAIWRKVDKHASGSRDGNDQSHEPADGCTARCISKALQNFADREDLRDRALAHAVDADWIDEREGRWVPGTSQPADPKPNTGRLRRG